MVLCRQGRWGASADILTWTASSSSPQLLTFFFCRMRMEGLLKVVTDGGIAYGQEFLETDLCSPLNCIWLNYVIKKWSRILNFEWQSWNYQKSINYTMKRLELWLSGLCCLCIVYYWNQGQICPISIAMFVIKMSFDLKVCISLTQDEVCHLKLDRRVFY
jgi:hypothetical protein